MIDCRPWVLGSVSELLRTIQVAGKESTSAPINIDCKTTKMLMLFSLQVCGEKTEVTQSWDSGLSHCEHPLYSPKVAVRKRQYLVGQEKSLETLVIQIAKNIFHTC